MERDSSPQDASAAGKTTLPEPLIGLTLNAAQCAELLFCGQAQVEELASKGELPATKFGRGWLFLAAQVIEVLGQCCLEEAAKRRAQREGANAPASSKADSLLVSTPKQPRPRGRKRRLLPRLD